MVKRESSPVTCEILVLSEAMTHSALSKATDISSAVFRGAEVGVSRMLMIRPACGVAAADRQASVER
jgi:hypothetical protein